MSLPKITEIITGFKEELTGYIANIDSDHAYIHKGIAFTAVIDVSTISAAYDIAFKTPTAASGKYIHWRPIGLQTSANYCKVELREGDTYSGGTTVTPINRNRPCSEKNKTQMQAFVSNATATPAGTLIQLLGVGSSGAPRARSGGGGGAAEEIVLKQDTIYILTITPSGETVVTTELFWYEEEDGRCE